jgi:hypothetical protein
VFRTILKKKIAQVIQILAISARQIGKVTWCVLGDEDRRFYHTRASARLRVNTIKVLESDGVRYFAHKEKECILTANKRDIMGKQAVSQPLIDFREVYPDHSVLTPLSKPFSEQEIYKALKQIPRDKSPTGLGQNSIRTCNIVKTDILNLFSQLFNEQCQMERNNRESSSRKEKMHVPPMHIGPYPLF